MPSRAQIMLMAVKFRKEMVEDMILVSCDPAEESFISIFCKLSRCRITSAI